MVNKAKVSKVTAIAMMEIMSAEEVAKFIDLSVSQLYRLKTGKHPIAHLPAELDEKFLKSLGLKICQACGVRLVPTKPVRHQKLFVLCECCWSSDFAEENYEVLLNNSKE